MMHAFHDGDRLKVSPDAPEETALMVYLCAACAAQSPLPVSGARPADGAAPTSSVCSRCGGPWLPPADDEED